MSARTFLAEGWKPEAAEPSEEEVLREISSHLKGIDWEAVREYWGKGSVERERILAALGVYPFTEKFTLEEIRALRESFGITDCLAALIQAFTLDVLMPPPFRPPLMLIQALTGPCRPEELLP